MISKISENLTFASLVLLATSLFTPQAQAGGPSFDCSKTSEINEQAICKSQALSKYDRIISADHDALTAKVSKPRADALTQKFHNARKKCNGDEADCECQGQPTAQRYGPIHPAPRLK